MGWIIAAAVVAAVVLVGAVLKAAYNAYVPKAGL